MVSFKTILAFFERYNVFGLFLLILLPKKTNCSGWAVTSQLSSASVLFSGGELSQIQSSLNACRGAAFRGRAIIQVGGCLAAADQFSGRFYLKQGNCLFTLDTSFGENRKLKFGRTSVCQSLSAPREVTLYFVSRMRTLGLTLVGHGTRACVTKFRPGIFL